MPRQPRIDIPGVLSHVLIRGIERRPIFLDDADRAFFLKRLGLLLTETRTDCLAWALMTNHAHLLLRPREGGLTPLMRRLLTAHAVRFNLRHQRAGYLFQNRFKSLPCEEQDYLLVAVRYVHLNPFQTGMVESLDELLRYPWTGHPAMMGKERLDGHAVEEVLALFGRQERTARLRYLEFMQEGATRKTRKGGNDRPEGFEADDLSCEAKLLPAPSLALGGEDFLTRIQRDDDLTRALADNRPPLDHLIASVAKGSGMTLARLCGKGRTAPVVNARRELYRRAILESCYPASQVARALGIGESSVSRMLRRGRIQGGKVRGEKRN
jgi:putative transposase